ncbi:MAG: SDR family NAD(P)-dependent oxidoreductase [Chitinophagaceae bacterium]
MSNHFYTLITGASEGFGKALAIECARRKMNLILVALPGAALYSLADFITLNYAVDVKCIEKDLCKDESSIEIYNEVIALGLQINALFNNAGIGFTGLFGNGCVKQYENQIKLNVLATTLMTRLFLDMLKQNSPSYILNVGSLASFFPLPKKQVYGATKSFIYYFSRSLRTELKYDKVYVSVLCPGGMKTNMAVKLMIENSNHLLRLSSMDPEKVAHTVINGILKKKMVIIPGKLNKCYVLLYTILPAFIKAIITNRTMKELDSDIHAIGLLNNPMAV